jgi:hypothetical protein
MNEARYREAERRLWASVGVTRPSGGGRLRRRIGLRRALEAGFVSEEVVGCYLALLRDTDTMGNELRAGPPSGGSSARTPARTAGRFRRRMQRQAVRAARDRWAPPTAATQSPQTPGA